MTNLPFTLTYKCICEPAEEDYLLNLFSLTPLIYNQTINYLYSESVLGLLRPTFLVCGPPRLGALPDLPDVSASIAWENCVCPDKKAVVCTESCPLRMLILFCVYSFFFRLQAVLSAAIPCLFDFSKYPYDEQNCSILLYGQTPVTV